MPNYLLLLHATPDRSDFASMSPEQIQAVIGEYMAWRKKIQDDGVYVASNKLRDEGGKSLSGANGDFRVTDGPFTEAKEVVGGFFIISAANYDEAAKVSQGCPHLKYGGRIELREVEPTP
jgi:hypothetical protein